MNELLSDKSELEQLDDDFCFLEKGMIPNPKFVGIGKRGRKNRKKRYASKVRVK